MPARVSLERSISGESDGEVHRVYGLGDRVTELVRVPTPVAQLSTVAVSRAGSGIDIATIDDLAGHRIVRVAGVVHAQAATEGLDGVVEVPDLDALLDAVLSGASGRRYRLPDWCPCRTRPAWLGRRDDVQRTATDDEPASLPERAACRSCPADRCNPCAHGRMMVSSWPFASCSRKNTSTNTSTDPRPVCPVSSCRGGEPSQLDSRAAH